MKKDYSDQVYEVILQAVERYGTRYKLSKATGVSQINLKRWVEGGNPGTSDVAPIMNIMGARIVMPDEQELDYDYVPKHAAKAGAGSSLETSGATEGYYAFRKDWMAANGIHASSAVLLDVMGDSMEPLFQDGDTLLVDKSDREIRDGKIYLITLGEELRVKRIFKGLTGLILRSENKLYPDVAVEGPDLETFIIHGRVKWCGKKL